MKGTAGDGDTDSADLTLVLVSSSAAKGCALGSSAAHTVGILDLLTLLATWGPCG